MKLSRVLIATEDDILRNSLQARLIGSPYQFIVCATNFSTLKEVAEGGLDLIILCASREKGWDTLNLAQQIRRATQSLPIILIVTRSSEELAIAALKCGINDYFREPFSSSELKAALKRCLSSFRRSEVSASRALPSELLEGDRMIGESKMLKEIKEYILKVAPTDSTVLVTGETGTGKELVAQLIHGNSPRKKRPFLCINCAAIPDTLLESELFGYDKGAFTGAHSAKEGKLKLADGGTVFFDEIGDMSPYAQAKILRTLEDKEVFRLGGRSSIPINVRVVAATNQNLEQLAEQGKFRKDLFFRLNVARIVLPPLRDRKEDIVRLLDHFIARFNRLFDQQVEGFEEKTLHYLLRHDWPGNIRELKNLLETIFLNRPSARISHDDLPHAFRSLLENTQSDALSEQERLLSALFSTNWNKSKAARRLQWSRMTLYRKLAKYQLSEKISTNTSSMQGR